MPLLRRIAVPRRRVLSGLLAALFLAAPAPSLRADDEPPWLAQYREPGLPG